MDTLMQLVTKGNDFLWSFLLLVLLCGTGLYYTIRLRFIQVRKFGEGVRQVFGHFSMNGEKHEKGEMTPFQSIATAIAAQVGTGNLAGAATALIGGGPGAIFWMWISAFLGMATIYGEAVLAQTYKTEVNGEVTGGPVYYIKAAFKGTFGKALSTLFAVFIILALGFMGNMVQSNSIGAAFVEAFQVFHVELSPVIVGIVVAVIAAVIFLGGTKSLATVVEKIVPIMAGIYIIGSLVVILLNINSIPTAFMQIIVGAFKPNAVLGGAAGITVREAIRYGVARGLFSNEAGMGAVPNAAAAADASHPVKQGLIQAMGVYFDTLFVCTASAMLVLLSPEWMMGSKLTGIALVQKSVAGQLGEWTNFFMTVIVLFFAFSSIIGNYFYGEMNMPFISKSKYAMPIFRVFVVVMVFVGSIASLSLVWDLADLFMALMAIVNLVAIFMLGKYAIAALRDYSAQKRRGILDPIFDPRILPDKKGVQCWPRDEDPRRKVN